MIFYNKERSSLYITSALVNTQYTEWGGVGLKGRKFVTRVPYDTETQICLNYSLLNHICVIQLWIQYRKHNNMTKNFFLSSIEKKWSFEEG